MSRSRIVLQPAGGARVRVRRARSRPVHSGPLLSRRHLLGLVGVTVAGVVLAACDAGNEADEAEPSDEPRRASSTVTPSPVAVTPSAVPVRAPTLPPVARQASAPSRPSRQTTAAVALPAPVQLGPVQIRVLVPFDTKDRPGQAVVLAELADGFVRREPNVDVRYTRLLPTPETRQELAGLFGTGSRPDVMLPVTTESLHAFLHEGAWLEIAPLARRDAFDTSDFEPAALAVARGTSLWGVDSERLVGVPLGVSVTVVALRAEALASAGIALDDLADGWSLPQLNAAADAARTADRPWGVAGWEPFALLRGFGASEIDAGRTRVTLSDGEYVAAMQTWQDDIFVRGFTPNLLERAAAGGVPRLWVEGPLNFRVDRLDAVPVIAAQTSFEWVLAPAPRGPAGPASMLAVSTALVVARTANPEAAWRWVRYVAEPGENAARMSQAFGLVPARRGDRERYRNALVDRLGTGVLALPSRILPDGVRGDEWMPRQPEIRGNVIRPALRRIESGVPVAAELGTAQAAAQALVDAWLGSGNRAPVQG